VLDTVGAVLRYAGAPSDAYWMAVAKRATDLVPAYAEAYAEAYSRHENSLGTLARSSARDVDDWFRLMHIPAGASTVFIEYSRMQEDLPFADRRHEGTLLDGIARIGVPIELRAVIQAAALQARAFDAVMKRLTSIVTDEVTIGEHRPRWIPHYNAPRSGVLMYIQDEVFPDYRRRGKVQEGRRLHRAFGLPSLVDAAWTVERFGDAKEAAAVRAFGQSHARYVAALADVTVNLLRAATHARASGMAKDLGKLLAHGGSENVFDVERLANWDRRLRELSIDMNKKVDAGLLRSLEHERPRDVDLLDARGFENRVHRARRLFESAYDSLDLT
jgi:hypothetical protein